MKNYDELTNDLLERRDQYITEQRNKRKVMKRVITPICCFCLVALLGIGLWQGDFFNSKLPVTLDDSTIIGEKDTIDDNDGLGGNDEKDMIYDNDGSSGNDDIDGHWSPNDQEAPPNDSTNSATSESNGTTEDVNKQVFFINEIKSTVSAALKYLDPSEHYEEIWDADKTAHYLGMYLNNIRHNGLNYQGDGKHKVTYKNNGELARDIMSFEYSFQDTKVIVSTSKISYPYDSIYALDDEKISTYVQGIPVVFAGTVGTTAEHQVNKDFLVADFEHNGVNYRVKAENITHGDFYKVVQSIITG